MQEHVRLFLYEDYDDGTFFLATCSGHALRMQPWPGSRRDDPVELGGQRIFDLKEITPQQGQAFLSELGLDETSVVPGRECHRRSRLSQRPVPGRRPDGPGGHPGRVPHRDPGPRVERRDRAGQQPDRRRSRRHRHRDLRQSAAARGADPRDHRHPRPVGRRDHPRPHPEGPARLRRVRSAAARRTIDRPQSLRRQPARLCPAGRPLCRRQVADSNGTRRPIVADHVRHRRMQPTKQRLRANGRTGGSRRTDGNDADSPSHRRSQCRPTSPTPRRLDGSAAPGEQRRHRSLRPNRPRPSVCTIWLRWPMARTCCSWTCPTRWR